MNNHYDPNQPRNAEGMWTDAGSAIRAAASDKNDLTNEEKADAKENGYKNPVATRNIFEKPYYDNKNFKQEAGYYHNNKEKALTEFVSIDDIHPTQLTIDRDFKSKSNELPLLIKNDKGIHVLDGHHRIAQEVRNGVIKIKAKVLFFNTTP